MIRFIGVDSSVPLEDREKFFADHRNHQDRNSGVVLSTCDRVEIYSGEGNPEEKCYRHILRVVSGLESPILGENQIQGQVKRAYLDACEKGTVTPGLHRLFQNALRVGKRIRTETKINQGALGHAQRVIKILQDHELKIHQLEFLIIGVNNLNRGILKFLVDHGNRTFFLGNRTWDKAQTLCQELGGGTVIHLDNLASQLITAQVVISATSAPHPIILPRHMPPQGGPQWLFDLAVPRDIDPEIGKRPGVHLYNVTDLENHGAKILASRQEAVKAAEKIIEEEVFLFFQKTQVKI